MPPITETIADTITGGQLTEARNAAKETGGQLVTVTGQYLEVLAETRRLSRDVETLKEGGVLAEGYADSSWQSRITTDRRWQLISGYEQHRIIQKSDVDLYHDLMAYAYMFSPLIKAAIDIKTRYTFGLSYSIESEVEGNQATINKVMDDPRNRNALFGAQAIAEADRELQKGGNIYIAIWWREDPVQIRVWSAYEISNVLTDPQDVDTPLFYVRSWTDANGNQHTKAYPSLFNDGSAETLYEVDDSILVYQMSEGRGLKQKWAVSPYTSALPWNRAYEGFLLDFAAIVQTIRKYSTMFTTKGGEAQVSALQTQFAHETHGHHAQQVGDGLISTEGNDFKVIDAGSGKIVGPQDSRYFLLQVCASTGVPENLLTGNPQTGNRASAQELTTNFLPIIEERQTMWEETFTMIFGMILEDSRFDVSFPPIRSQDALSYLQTLTQAATLGQAGKFAGTIRPEDFIKAAYEAMDLKVPNDATIDEMVQGILDAIATDPAQTDALDNLTQATNQMNAVVREALMRFPEVGDDVQWITINGMHIPIKPGETTNDAIQRAINYTGGGSGSSSSSDGSSGDNSKSKSSFKTYDKADLNKDQIKAINRYKSTSNDDYEKINAYVRDGKVGTGSDPDMETTIKNLDSSFTERVPQGTTIYNGKKSVIYSGIGKTQGSQLLDAKVGDTFEDRDYQSFSTDPEVARGFAKGIGEKTRAGSGKDHVVLKFEGDGDTPCINIGGTEKEVLLPRGKTFEVVDKRTEKTSGIAVFHTITVRIKK